MFGTYRTILALAVIIHHLLKVPSIGQYAVHGFFILSGYLMTFIMHKSYGYNLKGFISFTLNRVLRLYPSYWVVMVLTIMIVLFTGEQISRLYHPAIYIPSTLGEWAQNTTMFFANWYPMLEIPRLAPPTWALTLEILFYILIGLGVSKSRSTTTIWFSLSLLFTIGTHFTERGYEYRYLLIGSASLPFCIGALIYHYADFISPRIARFSNVLFLTILMAVFVINSAAAGAFKLLSLSSCLQSLCFYVNLILNTLIVALLAGRPVLPISDKIDKIVGEFSYPLYLFHWQAWMLVSYFIYGEPQRGPTINGLVAFFFSLLVCIIVSFLLIYFVERPTESIRTLIRKKARNIPSHN